MALSSQKYLIEAISVCPAWSWFYGV